MRSLWNRNTTVSFSSVDFVDDVVVVVVVCIACSIVVSGFFAEQGTKCSLWNSRITSSASGSKSRILHPGPQTRNPFGTALVVALEVVVDGNVDGVLSSASLEKCFGCCSLSTTRGLLVIIEFGITGMIWLVEDSNTTLGEARPGRVYEFGRDRFAANSVVQIGDFYLQFFFVLTLFTQT